MLKKPLHRFFSTLQTLDVSMQLVQSAVFKTESEVSPVQRNVTALSALLNNNRAIQGCTKQL